MGIHIGIPGGGTFDLGPVFNKGKDKLSEAWDNITGQTNADIARENLDYEREVFEYQKKLQQDIFAREDNAVSRRVADLQRAGLSPTLAAGSAASVGPTVATKAPHREQTDYSGLTQMALLAYNLMKMKADVSKTYAENKLIEMQQSKTLQEQQNLALDAAKKAIDNARNRYDFNKQKESGLTSKPSAGGSIFRDVTNVFNSANDALRDKSKGRQVQKIGDIEIYTDDGIVKGVLDRTKKRSEFKSQIYKK